MSSSIDTYIDSSKTKKLDWAEKIVNIGAAIFSITVSLLSICTFITQHKPFRPANAEISSESIEIKHIEDFGDDDGRLSYTADLMDQGHDSEAIEFLNEFLKCVESDSEIAVSIHFNLGLAHFHLEEWNEAVTDFAIAANQANHSDAYYNLALAKMKLNENESALELLDKALSLQQKHEYEVAKDAILGKLNP